uniref:RNA helicase n=1 Tax=Panagrellus redivivus TaxID=6233 RepID=A0A7E4V5A7_PANRE
MANSFGRGAHRTQNQNNYPDVGNLSLNDQPASSRGGPPRPPPGRYDAPEDHGPPTPPGFGNRQPQINRNAFKGSSPNDPPPSSGFMDRPARNNVPPPPGFDRPQSVDPRVDIVNRKQSTHSNNSSNGFRDDSDPCDRPPPPNGNLPRGDGSAPADLNRHYGNQNESYEQNGNYNRGRGGFNESHGGQNQGYQGHRDHDSRGGAWNNGNSRQGGIDAPRGGYGNGGGYGASRNQYAAPNDYYGPPPNDYNAPCGGGGGGGYNGHNGDYNAPRGGYSGFDNRQSQGGATSNHHANYRNPNDYRYDNGHGPPMSHNRQNSYESTGSNQSYSRNNFPSTGGNDVPLGSNGRFANTNQNPRPPSDFNNGHQGNGRPEVPSRAPRDYVPQDRNVNEIFKEDQQHTVHDSASLMNGDAEIEVKGLSGLEQVKCEQWSDMELHPKIMANIKMSGYTYPRKIQQNTIPYIMDNRDIMCQGETGSGKTAAFLIPTIHKFLQDKESGAWKFTNRPYCLIVSPTRELANQLYDQAKKFANGTVTRVERAYGEINVKENVRQVARCDILVGCVGRLHHFMERGELVAADLKVLIVDEADRLFSTYDNQKFYEMFRYFSSRAARQTLLFSATLGSPEVKSLAQQHMKEDYIEIVAKTQSNSRIRYFVYPVEDQIRKIELLTEYLRHIISKNRNAKCLVFVKTKEKTYQVAVDLIEKGIKAITVHAGRSQDLREEALQSFKNGETPVLIATDVVARGMDVYAMDFVVNMDLPNGRDIFVQRCGRTGRLQEGEAVSFYHEPTDRSMGAAIAKVIENSQQVAPPFLRDGVTASDYDNINIGRERPGRSTPPRAPPRPRASPTHGRPSPAVVIPDQSVNEDW